MSKYFFMKLVLDIISQGKLFRKVFAIVLRVCGILIIIASVVGFIALWKIIFQLPQLPAFGIVGGIIFLLFFIVTSYMIVHTLFIRAENINKLSSTDFTVISIVSIFLKLVGEIYACFGSFIAVGGGILIWFAGSYAYPIIREIVPFAPGFGETFVGGILFILVGLLLTFFILVLFYFLAEEVVVFADIARNTKIICQGVEQNKKTNSSEWILKSETTPKSDVRFCTNCGTKMSVADSFCSYCGTKNI